jgi:hypothetical protein
VSKVKRLITTYNRHITIPWRDDAAAAQRVIFCVYNENEERALRARIDEFELVTRQAEHGWAMFDLTDSFAAWMGQQRYAQKYFQNPRLLDTVLPRFPDYIEEQFDRFVRDHDAIDNMVVAIQGVGSLFGFVKVKDVVDRLAPRVTGRLLVFFPGSYENNNYRLLDGYDGWNYLAVPITAGTSN